MNLSNSIIQLVSLNRKSIVCAEPTCEEAPEETNLADRKPCLRAILATLVKNGEPIQVEMITGKTITGRVTQFGNQTITLEVTGTDKRATVFHHAIAMFGNY